MARVIADALDGDLDVILVRKIRAPGQPELAIGAVDEQGAIVKGRYYGIASEEYLREEIRTQQELLRGRRARYTEMRAPIDPAGRTVIVVDDGIATGASMISALRSLRSRKPQRLVVAIGVAPASSLARLHQEADEVVCLHTPEDFYAVGEFYVDFSEVTDDMVVDALARPAAAQSRRPDQSSQTREAAEDQAARSRGSTEPDFLPG
jgi:predicted phosphoribosyltransferase